MTDTWQLYIASSAGQPGLWTTRLDPANGGLDDPEPLGGPPAATFLRVGPGGVLYAVSDDRTGADGLTGRLHGYVCPPSGQLVEIAERRTEGTTPCHISISPDGAQLYVANFRGAGGRPSAGSAAVFRLDEDGMPAPPAQVLQHGGSSVHPERQTNPHFHSIVPDPSGEFVLVADLGIDALVLYVREEVRERPLLEVDRAATPPGSGPRHVACSPDGRFAFVVHEMSNDVSCYRLHRRGELEHVSTTPTIPEAFQGDSAAADLHVHPSGRYLYASNRGHDSIAVIEVHEQGHLEWAGCTAAGGGNPRGFALTPDGAFLVAAGAADDTLTAFRIDESSGELQPTGASASVPSPVCVGITAGV